MTRGWSTVGSAQGCWRAESLAEFQEPCDAEAGPAPHVGPCSPAVTDHSFQDRFPDCFSGRPSFFGCPPVGGWGRLEQQVGKDDSSHVHLARPRPARPGPTPPGQAPPSPASPSGKTPDCQTVSGGTCALCPGIALCPWGAEGFGTKKFGAFHGGQRRGGECRQVTDLRKGDLPADAGGQWLRADISEAVS